MPVAHPVYQATTVNYDEYSTDGAYRGGGGVFFLRSSQTTSRWPGRKRRLRIAVVAGAIVAAIAAIVTLAVSISEGSGALGVLVAVLAVISMLLWAFVLRMDGRLELPCWPSRAARFSRSMGEFEYSQTPRSNTQVTFDGQDTAEMVDVADAEATTSAVVAASAEERSKLMKDESALEAETNVTTTNT